MHKTYRNTQQFANALIIAVSFLKLGQKEKLKSVLKVRIAELQTTTGAETKHTIHTLKTPSTWIREANLHWYTLKPRLSENPVHPQGCPKKKNSTFAEIMLFCWLAGD